MPEHRRSGGSWTTGTSRILRWTICFSGSRAPIPIPALPSVTTATAPSQGTLVETLSRGTWRVTPSPMAGSPYLIDSLNAVSCVSARTCTAVGSATNQMGTKGRTLVETLSHGTWRVSPSPNLRAALSTLSGASCTPPNGCVAVGDDETPSFQKTLVERQINGTWRLMPSPDASPPYVVNYLNVGVVRIFDPLRGSRFRRRRYGHELPYGHRDA